MANTLPRLRMNLDFMPSPIEDRPGLMIRDPYQYSDATLIIPPVLVQVLELFDGESTDLDLRQTLVRITGDLRVGEAASHLIESLSGAGFLEDETYQRMCETRRSEFAESPLRLPAHAGSAYPDEEEPLRETIAQYMGSNGEAACDGLAGIASPHISPAGGWECYREAYRWLGPEHREKTFVILGTSHYGEPDRFGLTRKNFATPFGEARTDTALVDRLEEAAPGAVLMEDYCHATEHSIEFQVVFLQHLFGPGVRILPVLCGSFARSIYNGGLPEDNEDVRRFLGELGEIAAREKDRLLWVLGVDMAHMGRRYGDSMPAQANQDWMLEVDHRDHRRIERINAGDARGFWELVKENQDDLKWCGSAPFYTFLRAAPFARGRLSLYQQWNIDEQSVVSFAGMAFTG